jgi:hypothetical protein
MNTGSSRFSMGGHEVEPAAEPKVDCRPEVLFVAEAAGDFTH